MLKFIATVFVLMFVYVFFRERDKSKEAEKEKRARRNKISEDIYNKKLEKERESTLEYVLQNIEIVHQKDDFEGNDKIFFNNISKENYTYLPMYYEKYEDDSVSDAHLGLGFLIFSRAIVLEITIYGDSQMGLAMGDRLILLFEDKEKIIITFDSARTSNYLAKLNYHVLSDSELLKFSNTNLDKWKLISRRRGVYVLGDNSFFYEKNNIQSKKTSQEVLKYLAKTINYKSREPLT